MLRTLLPYIDDTSRSTLLTKARSIAVIGAKDRAGHPVDGVGRYLLQAGYRIFPVHPTRQQVWGLPTWKQLTDITEPIDIVNVFRSADACLSHAEETLTLPHRPLAFWMQLGIVNTEAAAMVDKAGIMCLADLCIKTEHQRLAIPAIVPSAASVNTKPMTTTFHCQQCGQCCEGTGGIVLGQTDRTKLCAHLGLDEATFLARYAKKHNNKYHIRCGADGRCVFFCTQKGCLVHEHKPRVCEAWPFFRGNLVDETSFTLAKGYCPGIQDAAEHAAFVAEGTRYLTANNLTANAYLHDEPTALMPAKPWRNKS